MSGQNVKWFAAFVMGAGAGSALRHGRVDSAALVVLLWLALHMLAALREKP